MRSGIAGPGVRGTRGPLVLQGADVLQGPHKSASQPQGCCSLAAEEVDACATTAGCGAGRQTANFQARSETPATTSSHQDLRRHSL